MGPADNFCRRQGRQDSAHPIRRRCDQSKYSCEHLHRPRTWKINASPAVGAALERLPLARCDRHSSAAHVAPAIDQPKNPHEKNDGRDQQNQNSVLQRHDAVAAGPGSALVSQRASLRSGPRSECNHRSHPAERVADGADRHAPDSSTTRNPSRRLHCHAHRRPPVTKNKNKNIQSASIACQYIDVISTAVLRAILRAGRNATTNSATIPPAKCTPCAAVIR